jgi:hypothetical protein
MNGSVNLPVLGRVDKRSLLIGGGIVVALMVLPKVSDQVIPLIAKLRNMFGGNK